MKRTRAQRQTPSRPRPRRHGAGFTLVELLIAMLILAIGIMAILQMQFSSMGSAMISRDNANASDIAQRVLDVMRVESMQWRQGSITSDVGGKAFAGTAFKSEPVLTDVEAGAWGWVKLFDNPVDPRLTTTGPARYCAYARGGYLEAGEVFTVQIAVVFPSANNAFPAADTPPPATVCPDYGAGKLDDSMDPLNANSLQLEGFKVQFFGSQIYRRDYLGG